MRKKHTKRRGETPKPEETVVATVKVERRGDTRGYKDLIGVSTREQLRGYVQPLYSLYFVKEREGAENKATGGGHEQGPVGWAVA
ncbi:Smc3p [Sesbania bispinosa]|nr:Smc3p [Sesbania bispinosa]